MDQVSYYLTSQSGASPADAEKGLREAVRQLSPTLAPNVHFQVDTSLPRILAMLRSHGADALVLDTRGETGPIELSPAIALLRTLFPEHDLEGAVARTQTWLVVEPGERGLALCFEAGKCRIAGAIAASPGPAGWRQIWHPMDATVRRRHGGKIALCLAGGGIEGAFYEMGVLRALQTFLPDFPLQNADIICGISAGSILGCCLANGLSPDDIIRGMIGGVGTLDKLGRLDVFDLNTGEFVQRLGRGAANLLRRSQPPIQTLMEIIPSGAFKGDSLRRYLRRQMAKPGMTDDFTRLRRKFFVGATNQDTAEHVVFGTEGLNHIPIHKAVRASSALTPFYAPEVIEGRYYIDGGFTRTSNIQIAVKHGATLVIVVDPLVPIASERPGYVASKGAVLATMQGLKSLIHGRFGRAASMLRTMFPHVSIQAFHPELSSMRVMAGSPMKFFYRPEIEEIAFTETVRSIRQRRIHGLQRDFARHGVLFSDPAEGDISRYKRDMLDEADEVLLT